MTNCLPFFLIYPSIHSLFYVSIYFFHRHITHNISQLVNLTSALVSLSYGVNTLYITHYFITQQSSPTVVYTISTDIHDINSNHTLSLGVVRANPSSQQFKAISNILLEVQPLPGKFLILYLSNCIKLMDEWMDRQDGLMY